MKPKFNVCSIRHYINPEELKVFYEGYLSQSLIFELSHMVKLDTEIDENPIISQRVFFVMVEQLQNIIRYAAPIEEKEFNSTGEIIKYGIFIYLRGNNSYTLISGNYIYNHQVESLINKLTSVVNADEITIKSLYKMQLERDNTTIPYGAGGIGLVEIRKKTSIPLSFTIDTISDTMSFFTLKVEISKN